MSEETGIALELRRGERRGRAGFPDESFDLVDVRVRRLDLVRSVRSGFRRRRGCYGPAASSSSSATRALAMLCSPDERQGGRDSCMRPQFGMHRLDWPDDDEGRRVPPRPTARWCVSCATAASRSRALWEIQASETAKDARLLRLRPGRVGTEVAGRGDLEGPQARVSVPPEPPIILASRSPQRRAILEQFGHPVRRRSAEVRRGIGGSTRSKLCVKRARKGALRRARARTSRCSASIRRSSSTARRSASRPAQPRRRRCSSGSSGRTHEVVSGLCLRSLRRWEELRARDDAGHVPAADGPRSRALHREAASGKTAPAAMRSRASAARSSSAIEGDYLNVVGLPAALLVRLLAERFPGTYGFG